MRKSSHAGGNLSSRHPINLRTSAEVRRGQKPRVRPYKVPPLKLLLTHWQAVGLPVKAPVGAFRFRVICVTIDSESRGAIAP